MSRFIRLFCLFFLMAGMLPAFAMDVQPFENVPIQNGGRKKPLLAYAVDATRTIHGRTTVHEGDQTLSATEFVLSLWLSPENWEQREVILVNHRPLKIASKLNPDQKYFSYHQLAESPGFLALLNEASSIRQKGGKLAGLPKEASQVGMRMAELEEMTKGIPFCFHPSEQKGYDQESLLWLTIPDALKLHPNPTLEKAQDDMTAAFRAKDDEKFHESTARWINTLNALHEAAHDVDMAKIKAEQIYLNIHPFRWAWIAFVAAGILAALTSWKGRKVGYIGAWILALTGFVLLLAGLAARCYVAGRPPVTNMFESVVWVSLGIVTFGLVFEAIYRCRTYLYVALPVAVIGLILADTQPMILDSTIRPLEPVLRDNFWLTIHVLTITLSYAAFALALGIAHIPLTMVIFGKKPPAPLYNYLYRILQIGVLLLASGTIFGAVWANYSWGRFWDWDPKETWALVALLGYLFVLHGRLAGYWAGFGMAVGSVVGFLSIMMAWYGVNFVLGAGLHSYGFGSGGFSTMATFVVIDLIFVAIAIMRYQVLNRSRKGSKRGKKKATPHLDVASGSD